MSHTKSELMPSSMSEATARGSDKTDLKGRGKTVRSRQQSPQPDIAMGCYPPVGSVVRALEILREVNAQRVATVRALHKATGQNKSTIVRMLQTLMDAGYVVADKLCGGYRATSKVQELVSGYSAVSRVIDAARPYAVDLTERFSWPVGLGTVDGDAISLQLYTGAISPWSHSDGVLRKRPYLTTSAMGRAYLAFCSPEELKIRMKRLREMSEVTDSNQAEIERMLLTVREAGFAMRDPNVEPRRMTTISMPVRERGQIVALMSCCFYNTIIGETTIVEYAAKPLAAAIAEIENDLEANSAANDPYGVRTVVSASAPTLGGEGASFGGAAPPPMA